MKKERITKKIGILYWANQKNLKNILPDHLIPGQIEAFINLTQDTEIRQDELVSKIGVTKAIGTRVIKKFEEGGFIRKRQCPEDHRVTLISLTDKGEEMKQNVFEIYDSHNESLFQNFSEEEKETIHKLLDKMITNAHLISLTMSDESQ